MSQALIVPLSQIREGSVALRPAQKESPQYKELVESIRERGFMGAITVHETQDETGAKVYTIIDGCQRTAAARDAGLTEIPVLVTNGKSEFDILADQIVMNAHGVDTKPVEYTKQIKRMLHLNPLLTKAELAQKIGKSTAFIDGRLKLLDLDENIQKLVDEGAIKLGNATALSVLPVADQAALAQQAMTMDLGEFTGVVGERQKQLKEAKKSGGAPSPIGFVLVPKILNRVAIESAIANPAPVIEIINKVGATSVEDIVKTVLQYTLSSDPVTAEARKAKWEADQAAQKKAREERAAQRKAEKEKAEREKAANVAAAATA